MKLTLITQDTDNSDVIILWSNKALNQAKKVLCINRFNNRRVLIGTTTVMGINGNKIRSQGSVESSEAIAPVGNSGKSGTPVHLHLELNKGEDNPLLYLQHGDSNYTITFKHPTDVDDGKL